MRYLGIDLGGTNIAVGLVDNSGNIIYKLSTPTLSDRGIKEIVEDIVQTCRTVVSKAGFAMNDVKAAGIGCPGTIDSKNGIVVYSNNIKMEKIKLCGMLKDRLNMPVNIENDANAAALGEYIINGDQAESFVFVTLGTGVGGGVIINGNLYRGFNGAGGELGHIIINMNGEDCTCGNKGCWEAYASVTALIRQTKRAISENKNSMMKEWVQKNGGISGKTAFECAKLGDKTAQAVVEQYISYVGTGLISVLNIFQPECIMIGGGISREGDYLIKPLSQYVYSGDYNKYMKKTKIKIASLYNDAGIIGAAMSARY